MASEALRNIRTMRQIKTSLENKTRKIRTTNQLSRTSPELDEINLADNGQTAQILAKEKARFAAFEASANKSRQRLLKSREKLATTIRQNRALTELRHDLQKARWENSSQVKTPLITLPSLPQKHNLTRTGTKPIELEY